MKRFIEKLTRPEAARLIAIANEADGSARGVRGAPAPGHQAHPHSPLTWDGPYDESPPPGWSPPHRAIENPRVPGEFMVKLRQDTVDRIAESEAVSDADKTEVATRSAAAAAATPSDYIDSLGVELVPGVAREI